MRSPIGCFVRATRAGGSGVGCDGRAARRARSRASSRSAASRTCPWSTGISGTRGGTTVSGTSAKASDQVAGSVNDAAASPLSASGYAGDGGNAWVPSGPNSPAMPPA